MISLCCVLTLSPALTLAQEVSPADVAIITRAGVPAPFTGVLYSDRAYAEEKARKEQERARADERLKLELGLQAARLTLATSTTAAALEAERSKNIELTRIRDAREAKLEDDLIKAADRASSGTGEKLLWFGAGVAVTAVAIVVGAVLVGKGPIVINGAGN